MKTKAVRIYGVNDLRLEEFDLPDIGSDGVRVEIVSDSLCMSSYKAASQGAAHKRVPDDVATNPTIIGHDSAAASLKSATNGRTSLRSATALPSSPRIFMRDRSLRPVIRIHIAAAIRCTPTFRSKRSKWIACSSMTPTYTFTAP